MTDTTLDARLSAVLRKFDADEFNDSLDVEDRASLMHDLVTSLPGPVRGPAGVVLCRYADIQQVTRNAVVEMGDPGGEGYKSMGADHALGPHSRDGDEHRRYRKTLDPVFSAQRVAGLADDIRTLANELIDGFIDDGQVEFHDQFAVPLPCKIFLKVLGLPQDDLPELLRLKDGILRSGGANRQEHNTRALAGGHRLRAYLGEQLDRRVASGERHDDLIDGFIHAEFEGRRLERDEIVDTMHLFCLAGLDTVTSSFSCLVGWLARRPEQRQRLVDDPTLVPKAVEELLRIETPVVAGTRFAMTDVDIDGFTIHAGERITLLWAAANMDPDHTADPLRADFDREGLTHLTFASGFHRCIGSHLARLELRLGLEELHRRIPDYWIAPDQEPTYVDIGIRAAVRLPLQFRPT